MPDSPIVLRVSQRSLDEAEASARRRLKKPEPLSEMTRDVERKRTAEAERQAHSERFARLLANGWQEVSPTVWVKDTSDPRWSTTASVEITAATAEDATRAAVFKQGELDAIARQR